MYTYVYDNFVTDKEHERLLSRVETRLTDLGISGRIERLTMFKDMREVVEDAIARGCETMVAVGNDETVSRLVEVLGYYDGVALGVIPVGEGPHAIADMLGIESDIESCNILSRRVLETIDLGKLNDDYFLSSVHIPRTKATVSCNGKYSVVPKSENEVRVCNLANMAMGEDEPASVSSPHDGYLETMFRAAPSRGFFSRLFRGPEKQETPTVVPVRNLVIRHSSPFTVFRDGQRLSSTMIKIEIIPNRLKVVVGRNRKFA